MKPKVTVHATGRGGWGVWVNGRQVGRGYEETCRALADELAADDKKAMAVHAAFAAAIGCGLTDLTR